VSRKGEDAITFGVTLEAVVLFLSLALAVNLAVYGWLGALGAWSSSKDANQNERLVYLFIASIFTVLAAGAWYTLAFVVRPFG
jgi:hypothetical protein